MGPLGCYHRPDGISWFVQTLLAVVESICGFSLLKSEEFTAHADYKIPVMTKYKAAERGAVVRTLGSLSMQPTSVCGLRPIQGSIQEAEACIGAEDRLRM